MAALTIKLAIECPACAAGTCGDADNYGDCDEGLVQVAFPGRYEVCGRCDGKGSHVNPNIDGNGITSEEWERDWDEDSREGYFSGRYDVTCEECGGERVVAVVDEARLSDEQRAQYVKAEEYQAEVARENYEDAYTRRMESGGRDW